jgi:hypothetical protein
LRYRQPFRRLYSEEALQSGIFLATAFALAIFVTSIIIQRLVGPVLLMAFDYGPQIIIWTLDLCHIQNAMNAESEGIRALFALETDAIVDCPDGASQELELSVILKHLFNVVVLDLLLFEQILVELHLSLAFGLHGT